MPRAGSALEALRKPTTMRAPQTQSGAEEELSEFVVTNAGLRMPRMVYGLAWKEADTHRLAVQAVQAGFRGIDTAGQVCVCVSVWTSLGSMRLPSSATDDPCDVAMSIHHCTCRRGIGYKGAGVIASANACSLGTQGRLGLAVLLTHQPDSIAAEALSGRACRQRTCRALLQRNAARRDFRADKGMCYMITVRVHVCVC